MVAESSGDQGSLPDCVEAVSSRALTQFPTRDLTEATLDRG